MTSTTAQRFLVLALAPLVLMGAMRPAAQADAGFSAGDRIPLELASLTAEARSLAVHIDGP